MRITKLFLFMGIVGLTFISGCSDKIDLVSPSLYDNLVENTPAIVNKQDTFTFAVMAKNYDGTFDYTLTFNSNILEVSLAIGNHSVGNVAIEIYNQNNNKIFQGNYDRGIALAQDVTTETSPTKIHFTLTNVSASVSLAVKTK